MKYNLGTQDDHRFYRTDRSSCSYVLYTGYCPLLFSVAHLEIAKYESLCDESITTIKKREKTLIDGITKHSQKLQNEIELERKTVKQTFCDMKRQADQAEKTIILHQDEI
jgi:hypothetical protein